MSHTPPDPRDLLRRAIAASGLSARKFAERIMIRDERTVRRWNAGEVTDIPEPVTEKLDWVLHPRIYRRLAAGGFVRYDGDIQSIRETSWPDLFPDAAQPLHKPAPSGDHFLYWDRMIPQLGMLTLGTPNEADWRALRKIAT